MAANEEMVEKLLSFFEDVENGRYEEVDHRRIAEDGKQIIKDYWGE